MSLDSFLLELLEDPIDHGKLYYVADKNVLYNPRRRVAYEVRGSIPVMLDSEARQVADDEHDSLTSDPSGVWTGPRG
ncbi:MAG: Trm112 family protein [Acidobacteriota bacterium]|nr:Trm112 family protein [Acidobacteriota bacterium]